MSKKDEIIQCLKANKIQYDLYEHAAAYTMEDIRRIGIEEKGQICKNLFLRNANGKKHYLVVILGDKRVDLRSLSEQVGSRLSFASDKRLAKYLNIVQGEVSPLGLFYDENHEVEVIFDRALCGEENLGVHPCDNAATVILRFADIIKLVEILGNPVGYAEIGN